MHFMSSLFLTAFLCLLPNAAQAMWKLLEMVEKETPSQWYDHFLNRGDLEGFLHETTKRGLNPNSFTSNLGRTALDLACAQDKTGEFVKKLLARDGFFRTYDRKIWPPLFHAVNAKNWEVVNILMTTDAIELSSEEVDYVATNMPIK